MPPSLAVLLESVGAKDRVAFEELYRCTSVRLLGICLRVLSVRAEAEDALHDAYLSIWRRAGTFDPARGSAAAWLAVLTRNAAIDRARRSRGGVTADDAGPEVADPSPSAWETLDATRTATQLHHCLATLDPQDASMIRTAFFDGSTYADLATAAGLPLGTVKSRIRRALLKMKERLQ